MEVNILTAEFKRNKVVSCRESHLVSTVQERVLLSTTVHDAYFLVHSVAISEYFVLSDLYNLAISGTRGSSGLGSVSSEVMDNSTEKKRYTMIR